MPKISSQHLSLQRTVERSLIDFIEEDKTFPQERISRIEAIKVPTFSSQEGVEAAKNIPQERISGKMREQREVINGHQDL